MRGRALDLARDSISSKRIKLDELLHNILGVRFFISAITALESSRGDDDDSIFPAVAYFIVYSHSDLCNGDTLLNAIQNEDRQANVVPINLRRCDRLLFNVVKDHSNDFVNGMVAASNRSGIQRQLINLGGPSTSSQQPVAPQHFPVTSTRIVVVDAQLGPAIHAARQNLAADGFQCEVFNFGHDFAQAIRIFKKFMKRLDNALYKVKHHFIYFLLYTFIYFILFYILYIRYLEFTGWACPAPNLRTGILWVRDCFIIFILKS